MDTHATDGEAALWSQLREQRCSQARDALYLRYRPWATAIARRVHRRFPRLGADRDDFIQNASIGLLEAIDRFDPARGIAFQAYAMTRVRGSVFNGLRVILGGASSERYQERLGTLQGGSDDPFNELVASIVGLGLGYMLDDAANPLVIDSHDALRFAEDQQVVGQLLAGVEQLPPRLKAIIVRHYFEFTPFIELAQEWGLSKGRISQLHRTALNSLRLSMQSAH